MTKKIFKYIELTVLITTLCGFAAVLALLYTYFGSVQKTQLKNETSILSAGVEQGGMAYLNEINVSNVRVTWISHDGTVLYDNEADPETMENHADREEFQEALKTGSGQSSRLSRTLTTEMIYSAKQLSDGSVLRVAVSRHSVLMIALGMIQPMIWIVLALLIVTWIMSRGMAKKLVQPLNTFDLDHPLENDDYPELAPFLHRIYDQQLEIEEQKENLAKTERDFISVTDNMAECLILLNNEDKVITINREAMKLLGVDKGIVGKDILYLERRTEFEKAVRGASKTGKHRELTLDYSGRSYQVDISPILTDKGKAARDAGEDIKAEDLNGMVVLMFDVTSREKAEELRREFSGNVSHELKTPLHTISGCAELLESGDVKPEDYQKFAHTIYTQSQRMISLVQDIIYISHLDEGAVDMTTEEVNLLDLCNRTADQLQQEAMKKLVRVSVTGNPAVTRGPSQLIESIVTNLMENAIKYNKDEGAVFVQVGWEGEHALFTVRDTGIGIPKEDLDRIFERFYRVDKSHSRRIGGTGLGLSIVKHAARLLGATVAVDSVLGEGSTFTVTFQ